MVEMERIVLPHPNQERDRDQVKEVRFPAQRVHDPEKPEDRRADDTEDDEGTGDTSN